MGFRDGLFRWTLPAGRWGGTTVRASVLFPVVGVAVALRTANALAGLLAAVGLLLAAAVTEAARGVAAARAGQPVRDVLLWPLGGLESRRAAADRPPWVHLCVPAAGAALCGAIWGAARLFGPPGEEVAVLLTAAAVVTAANLLPAAPLAAGRALRDMMARRFGPQSADAAALGLAHLSGVVVLFLAVAAGSAWAAAGAAVVLLIAHTRPPLPRPPRPRRREEDTFLGYDFSAGYTSLEGGADTGADDAGADDEEGAEPPRGPGGFLGAWRERRAAGRRRRDAEERLAAEEDVDRLLRKISAEGEAALTAAERRTLKRAAARFRSGPAEP